jgi:hypothetical protein
MRVNEGEGEVINQIVDGRIATQLSEDVGSIPALI